MTHLFETDLQTSVIIILNLILIESLLSVDNAAVLATMVMDLPEKQRGRALRIGLVCAYLFRGLSLVFVSVLISMLFLKAVGGLYLLWLCVKYFYTKATPKKEDDTLNKKENVFYKATLGRLGQFWATVVSVEFMDLTFSIDNVFAAVAFTNNIYLVIIGVFIGILAMRLAAQGFVRLLTRFPFLEKLAFIVVGILGVKLMASYACDYFPGTHICELVEGHRSSLVFSLITSAVFFLPILTSLAFNFPKRAK